MAQEQRQIFRQKSLEKMASPDRLDQLLRVVKPQSWILVGSMGIGLALLIVWSVFGRVPVTATGAAILVRPKQVVSFHAPASGPISSIEVSVGDTVKVDQVLAELHLPTLEKQLEQEKAKLEQFEKRRSELTDLEEALAKEELALLKAKGKLIGARIVSIRKAAEAYKTAIGNYIDKQNTNLDTAETLSKDLEEDLVAREKSYQSLKEKGDAGIDRVIAVRSERIQNQVHLAELKVQKQELELTRHRAQEYDDKQMDLIEDLKVQVKDLDIRKTSIDRQLRKDDLDNEGEEQEIRDRIGILTSLLENESRVLSEHDGTILEITAAVGQHVDIGERIGKMEIEKPEAGLKALAYFRVKDGKKIAKGAGGSDDGLKIRISPSTVERERFGAIVGSVARVSRYPITVDAAANEIGDKEIARNLLGGESRIEILVDLEPDADSSTGYLWTSGTGPEDVSITPGTTAEVRVTIESRPPITLILPFLKSMLGT